MYRAYLYGAPRSGNCMLWRTLKFLVGEPATLEDFLAFDDDNDIPGSIQRSHFIGNEPQIQPGPRERVIGVFRDPRDVLVSMCSWDIDKRRVGLSKRWKLGSKKARDVWTCNWMVGYNWITKNASMVVRYEDMLAHYEAEVERLCAWLNVDKPNMEELSEYIHPRNVKGHVRTGRTGDWKEALSPQDLERIYKYCGNAMLSLGYLWRPKPDALRYTLSR